MSSKLIFFGTEDFSSPSLEALIAAGHEIAAVVTKPDSTRGRGRRLASPLVKSIALEHDIPVFQPVRLSDIYPDLQALHADAAVLVSYGKIIPQRILDLFEPVGIINVHPSLLPRYRGPSPIESAILHGDEETGVSIMKLTAGMDEGPVFTQIRVPLSHNETKPTLYARLSRLGADELVRVLPDILNGSLEPVAQAADGISYSALLKKSDGILDPIAERAEVLERKIRAYLGYPKTSLTIEGTPVIVTAARAVETADARQLAVACADSTTLLIQELVGPSGKAMSGEAFRRGYRSQA